MMSSAKSLTDLQILSAKIESPCVWVRTGAGPQIGFGHLRRSVILAQELRDCCKPLFLINMQDHWSRERLSEMGFDIFSGDLDGIWSRLPEPAAVLIDTRIPDGLEKLNGGARARNIPVVSIHDLGLNPVASSIQIDGSILPAFKNAQGSEVHYSGTSYMVLDPAYHALHTQKKPIRRKIKSVFINLGGGDSRKYFLRLLTGLKLWAHEVEVVGVPGFTRWGQEEVERMDWQPVRFRWEPRAITKALFQADLAITAGGLSAYEALCAGTPLMALSHDGFQQSTISALAEAGACVGLGPGDDLDPARLPDKLSVVELNVMERQRLSWRGRKIVDGLGAERVSQIIRNLIFNRLVSESIP
jgi:UDP-2,4-diacetamido-2,4,6-trideoxy-beta-L-altropyranose hydrolase